MRYLKRNKLLPLLALTVMLLSGCDIAIGADKTKHQQSDVPPRYTLTREDRRTEPDASCLSVMLDESGEELLITEGGDYLLTGTLSGRIHVMAEEQVVHLFLRGAAVKASGGPALYVESAGKLIVTVCDGTENRLSDRANYPSDDRDACLFSTCDVTINGGGALTVSGYYKDAIHSKDYLKITGVRLSVQARNDGLFGTDGVMIAGADVSVEAEGNGIKSTKTGKEPKGSVEITDTKLSVIAGENAVTASRDICLTSSEAFVKGVQENFKADGKIYVEEGSLRHE